MTFPLNTLGLVRKFNGVDIEQTRNYNKVHCALYIDKIVAHHGWQNEIMRRNPTPMRADNSYKRELFLSRAPNIIHYICCSASNNLMNLLNNPLYSLLNEQPYK